MAYFRRSRYRKRRTRRSRYGRRTRTTRRNYRYRNRARVTTRRIRTIAARKAKDTMTSLPFTQDTPPAPMDPGAPVRITGNSFWGFVWNASGRQRGVSATGSEFLNRETRLKQRCFFKGVAEDMNFLTNSDASWTHRRIVFLDRGETVRDAMPPNTAVVAIGSVGYVRPLWAVLNVAGATEPGATAWADISDVLFDGQRNVDWSTYLTAKTDPQRVKTLYDRTTTIRSGNDRGLWKVKRFWHPVNRTIIYDDDEEAGNIVSRPWSSGMGSCGDVIVVDMFGCPDGTTDDELSIGTQARVYWHEGQGY